MLSYGVYTSQLVRFASCCTNFWISILKIFKSLPSLWHRVTDITSFGKHFKNSSDHTLSFYSEISFKEYVSQGISHLVCYGDLVYKLKRVSCEVNVVSLGSKIVKRLRRRTYDPVIIEKTIGLVIGPTTSLYRSFLKHCTPTKNAVGSMWRDLSKPPQGRQGPDPSSLWLLVGTPSVHGLELASRRAEHILLLRMPLYIFNIVFMSPCMFVW